MLPIEGELSNGLRGSWGWVSILKILIAVLTAIAGSIGLASCTGGLTPSLSQREGAADIAKSIMPCQYENAFTFREV